MQRDIQIVVKDRVARAVGQPAIVCGNCDYTVTFSFDDEWSEAGTKTARFKYLTAEGMKHIDKEFTGNVVQVPMLSNIREVEVGVYSTDLATSTGAPVRCEPSVRCSSGEGEQDIVQTIIEATQEACRAELEGSVETVTGESHDGKTWEELNDTVATLSTITEEQTQALGEWDLIKEYFADYAYHYHQLFSTGPTGADGNERTYSLPYIYTPKLQWRNNNIISPFLVEYGADVSMATTLRGGIFRNKNCLQRLVLTGNANAKSLYEFVFEAYVLKYIKFETPSKDMLNEDPAYYKRAFLECYALETIDCELDFTGQTDTTHMFTSCNRLKNLRIKPFTLSTSLDLGTCRSLHHNALHDYDSLISILNGITYDKETAKNITITFSSEITDFTQEMVRFWNRYVYFCDDGIYYADPSEVPEGYAYLEMPLYDAFMSKGVTIAWKQ